MTLIPPVRASVSFINAQRGALFNAARELLRDDGDRSAAVCRLRDTFPGATVPQLDRVLREAATQLVRV